MDPITIAAAASAGAGLVGFKGNQAAAKAAKQTAEYNAQLAENEAIVLARAKTRDQTNLRRDARRLEGQQRVATAASGIQMSGSPLQALADAYFQTEKDAIDIQYASDIEQLSKESEAVLARAEGRATAAALKTQGYTTLLQSGAQSATLLS